MRHFPSISTHTNSKTTVITVTIPWVKRFLYLVRDRSDTGLPLVYLFFATKLAFDVPPCVLEAYFIWIPCNRKVNGEVFFHHISSVCDLMHTYRICQLLQPGGDCNYGMREINSFIRFRFDTGK